MTHKPALQAFARLQALVIAPNWSRQRGGLTLALPCSASWPPLGINADALFRGEGWGCPLAVWAGC